RERDDSDRAHGQRSMHCARLPSPMFQIDVRHPDTPVDVGLTPEASACTCILSSTAIVPIRVPRNRAGRPELTRPVSTQQKTNKQITLPSASMAKHRISGWRRTLARYAARAMVLPISTQNRVKPTAPVLSQIHKMLLCGS